MGGTFSQFDTVAPKEAKTLPIYLNKVWTWIWSRRFWAFTGKHNYKEDLALVFNLPEIVGKSLEPLPSPANVRPQDQGRASPPNASSSNVKKHKKFHVFQKIFSDIVEFNGKMWVLMGSLVYHTTIVLLSLCNYENIKSGLFWLLCNFIFILRKNSF